MVKCQGIEVYIRRHSDKHRYAEYPAPQIGGEVLKPCEEAYVEATTGERFAIVVAISPEFDFTGFPDIKVSRNLDGTGRFYIISAASDVRQEAAIGASYELTMKSDAGFVDGQWMKQKRILSSSRFDFAPEVCYDHVCHALCTCTNMSIAVSLELLKVIPDLVHSSDAALPGPEVAIDASTISTAVTGAHLGGKKRKSTEAGLGV